MQIVANSSLPTPAAVYMPASRDTSASSLVVGADPADGMRSLLAEIVSLRASLEDFRQTFRPHVRRNASGSSEAAPGDRVGAPLSLALGDGESTLASVTSSTALGLNLTATAATLTSTAAINTVTNGFTPSSPTFGGGSTATPTVGGTYDGSNGDCQLTFKVTAGGNVGGPFAGGESGEEAASLQVEVRNSSDELVDSLSFDESTEADTEFTLANGLKVSFGAGALVVDDTFTVDVTASADYHASPDNPMNEVGASGPNFDGDLSVSDGAFAVNGVEIAVGSSDTINDVLARITASEAGVTAAYDADADTITLTRSTTGSTPTIALADDTSGFLVATKLDGATVSAGTDNDLNKPLSEVPALSSIQAGGFSVNGTGISVDASTQSLQAILDAINGSGAGVIASFADDKITLTALNDGESVVLDDGTAGLFDAVHITPGTYGPPGGGDGGSGGGGDDGSGGGGGDDGSGGGDGSGGDDGSGGGGDDGSGGGGDDGSGSGDDGSGGDDGGSGGGDDSGGGDGSGGGDDGAGGGDGGSGGGDDGDGSGGGGDDGGSSGGGDGGSGGGDGSGGSGSDGGDGGGGDDSDANSAISAILGLLARTPTNRVSATFRGFNEHLASIFGDQSDGSSSTEARTIRAQLAAAIRGAVSGTLKGATAVNTSGSEIDTRLGLSFDLTGGSSSVLHASEAELRQSMRRNPRALRDLLFAEAGTGRSDGLVTAMIKQLSAAENTLKIKIGVATAVFLDTFA